MAPISPLWITPATDFPNINLPLVKMRMRIPPLNFLSISAFVFGCTQENQTADPIIDLFSDPRAIYEILGASKRSISGHVVPGPFARHPDPLHERVYTAML